MTDLIDHPAVATQQLTCEACPEQYEGTLADGRWFYFRMRHGHAQLGIGATLDDAVRGTIGPGARGHGRAVVDVGNGLGMFDDPAQRDRTFATLYDMWEKPDED